MERVNAVPIRTTVQDVEEIHGTFIPADIRTGQNISVQIQFQDEQSAKEISPDQYRLWRLSPLGAEIAIQTKNADRFLGKKVDVVLTIGGQQCEFHGLVICSTQNDKDRVLLGFRWCSPEDSKIARVERRNLHRWVCSTNFLPTAVAPNPIEFSDLIFFRAIDFSRSGMKFVTSMRNKFIVPGMTLDAVITFPMVGSTRTDLIVKWASQAMENHKQVLHVGVEFRTQPVELLHAIGQYAIQFAPDATIEQIRASGLEVRYASKAMTYSYVRTEQDYKDVLALRAEAYNATLSRFGKSLAPEAMADIFDTRARILVARHQGRVVASARIIFHSPEEQLEIEKYVELPVGIARKDEMVEISRFCLHPDYRRSDLFADLIKHTYVAMLQAKRRWLVASAPPELTKAYQRVGCELLPVKYNAPECKDIELTVMRLDLMSAITGKNVSPGVWKKVYEDIVSFARTQGLLDLDTLSRIRMSAYRIAAPAFQIFAK